ncbi:hypothetical protein D3C87_2048590 [compost metagenome]
MDGITRFHVTALAIDVQLDRIVAHALQQDQLSDHFFRQRLVDFAGNNNRAGLE